MRQSEWKKRTGILLGMLSLCVLVCIGLYFYLKYTGYDIKGHWKICVYALNGYDPFPLIGKKAALPWVGKIPGKFSTVPWACIFGSVFYGGFLPLKQAEVYLWILHFVFWFLLAITIKSCYGKELRKPELYLLIFLVASQFSFMYSLRFGNMGAVVCCILVMSICLIDRIPWLSGILLGFAMMKPQIAAIVCLVYLLNKKWKPLVIGAAIDIAGLITTSIVTNTGMLQLLREMLQSGTASKEQYLGLCSFLLAFGWDRRVILLLNMLLGIGYTVVLWYYLKKKSNRIMNEIVLYAPACIASTFWMYKNGTDYLILAFASAFFVLLCMRKELSWRDFWVSAFGIGYLQMSRCLVYIGVLLTKDTGWGRNLVKSVDGFVLAIVGVILCRLWVKYTVEKESING